jgi:hypothetical protein
MSVFYSGSQLAVIGTEHTIGGADVTEPGSYILRVNTRTPGTEMQTNDITELRTYTKVIAAGALAVDDKKTLTGAQGVDSAVWKIIFRVDTGLPVRCTLKQTAGTGRTYECNIVKVD